MTECIFCKIIKNEILSYKVYEDEKTIAFLDIFPSAKGHTLVIPKEHKEFIDEMEDSYAVAVIKTVQKIARALRKYSNGVSILQRNGKEAGQVVPHVHFHIIPRQEGDKVSLDQWDGVTENKDRWDLQKVETDIQNLLNP